ncbi:MAG: Calx-beta domain-containing protein [Gemmataceae bacterium]
MLFAWMRRWLTKGAVIPARRSRKRSIRFRPGLEALEDRTLMATNLYVATTGNDGIGDGSLTKPYATLAKALSTAQDGDTIYLRGGTYAGGVSVNVPNLTLASYPGEWAIISAPVWDSSIPHTLRFDINASGGKLQRLEIVGGYYYTVKLETTWNWGLPTRWGASNILIEDCKLHDSGRDIIKITPGCNDVIIRRCEIYNSGKRDKSNAEGIDNVNGSNMVVQDCYIYNIATTGIYFKGGARNVVIERNLIINAGLGGIFVGFDTDLEWFDVETNPMLYESIDAVIRNNIIRNTAGAGIGVYASLRPQIAHNTLIDVAQNIQAGVLIDKIDHWISLQEPSRRTRAADVAFINNIVTQSANSSRPMITVRQDSVAGPLLFSNNRYYDMSGPARFEFHLVTTSTGRVGFTQWQSLLGGDGGSSEGDPLLNSQYHLSAGSPAIDAGLPLSWVTDDYDGNPRTGAPDIGADEYGAGPALPTPPPWGTIGTGQGTTQPSAVSTIQFSATEYIVSEGAGRATITVTRSGDLSASATVRYAVSDGTARAGSDYVATSGTIWFGAGQTTQTFHIPLIDDDIPENDETVHLSLSNPSSNAVLGTRATARLTILDDDVALPPPSPPPDLATTDPARVQFAAAEYSVTEGTYSATITVIRTGDVSTSVTVRFATRDGTATAGLDYVATSGVLWIAPGVTTQTFRVAIIDDQLVEPSETVLLTLSSPTEATLGSQHTAILTILDNDTPASGSDSPASPTNGTPPPPPPPSPGPGPAIVEFSLWAYTVSESAIAAVITVVRSGDTSTSVTVQFATRDYTAFAGSDYVATVGTLWIPPGATSGTFKVPIINDTIPEPKEALWLILSNPTNAKLGSKKEVFLNILDDD